MADPWTFEGESPSLGGPSGTVTLGQGSSFCISSRSGDILPDRPHGLFFRDTRFLSRFQLCINGQQPEPLTADITEPLSAPFVLRTWPAPHLATGCAAPTRHGRGRRRAPLSLRQTGGASRAPGAVAAMAAHRPRGGNRLHAAPVRRPAQRRGPRCVAHLRSRLPRARGG